MCFVSAQMRQATTARRKSRVDGEIHPPRRKLNHTFQRERQLAPVQSTPVLSVTGDHRVGLAARDCLRARHPWQCPVVHRPAIRDAARRRRIDELLPRLLGVEIRRQPWVEQLPGGTCPPCSVSAQTASYVLGCQRPTKARAPDRTQSQRCSIR
jgi:hypothetical protein